MTKKRKSNHRTRTGHRNACTPAYSSGVPIPMMQVTVQLGGAEGVFRWPQGICQKRQFQDGCSESAAFNEPELPDNSFWADVTRLQRRDAAEILQTIRKAGCALCRYRGGCGHDKAQGQECRDFTADVGLLGSLLVQTRPAG